MSKSIFLLNKNMLSLVSKLSSHEINSIQFPSLPQIEYDKTQFPGSAGKEHYKFLAWLSYQFSETHFIEIGTHTGLSAFCLASNPKNTVYTFDVSNKVEHNMRIYPNIKFEQANLLDETDRLKWEEKILTAPLIFFDISPHNGTDEYTFYEYLKEKKYSGLVVFDDIWYYKEMRDNFWYKIPSSCKRDITEFGHWAGTGLVSFDTEDIIEEVSTDKNREFWAGGNQKLVSKESEKSWTVVTAYFDLTKLPDASDSIKSRPLSYYLDRSKTTLSLDLNMVIYCDKQSYDQIYAVRPEFLRSKTRYVIMEFEDFPLNSYRNKIVLNRILKPYQFDDRNTASYYLFCMSRYCMMKETIKENTFSSTHFAWVNLCIGEIHWKNCRELEPAFKVFRDKFSTVYIDYIPQSLIDNLDEYFKWGRCSLASGFFTGNAYYMSKVCTLIENQFIEYVEKGYGHSDEQLYSPVYFKNRHLFEVYYGDYHSVVTNYRRIEDDVFSVLGHLCTNAFKNKDYWVLYDACVKIWDFCGTFDDGVDCLGTYCNTYLKFLLVSSTRMNDEKMMSRALAELKCKELGC